MVGVRANIIYVLRKQSVYIIWFWGELNLYFLVKRMALKSCCVLMICLNVGSLYAGQGQVLFEENCAACHGARGRNEGVPALDPAPREFGTGAMAMGFAMGRDKMRGGIWRRIRDGSPPHMPAFGEQLANEQLWSLVYFIEHL